jgi:molybdate transport system substrate-binding protein
MIWMRVLILSLLMSGAAWGQSIRVGAAISLKQAMIDIVSLYESQGNEHVELTFGSSGQLEAQISNGAAIDVFISAANKQVDELVAQGLALPQTRRVVAGNSVVLVVPADSNHEISGFQSLAGASVKRVAIGEPRTVPAGAYAMQVLRNLKLDHKLQDRIIYGINVRQVLSYVERAEVSAGIVYSTDARESGAKVKVVAIADPARHDPVEYPAVIIKASSKLPAAQRFLDFLVSEQAKTILNEKGFSTAAPHRWASTHPAE